MIEWLLPHNAYDHGIVTSDFDSEIRGDAQFPCIVLLCFRIGWRVLSRSAGWFAL